MTGLLDGEPWIVTAGVALFDEALAAQAVRVDVVDWRPPAGDTGDALTRIALDPRRAAANAEAVGRLQRARPQWTDVAVAGDAVDALDGRVLLHAGPPIGWDDASGPLRGAIIGALLYEGWAADPDDAARQAAAGEVDLVPCHHAGVVGPMAGVVSPSMPVVVVHDDVHGRTAHATLNEGLGKVLRYGAYGPEVLDRLRWMQAVLGPVLGLAIRARGPVDVRALVAQALQMGDECHNRNRAATSLLARQIAGDVADGQASRADAAAVMRFIDGNDHFFLNLVMPACKVAADAARDIPGATMVVAMARNGTEFGIQTSGTGDRWFTGPAGVPDGLYLSGYGPDDVNPDIGDSTITETAGIGAFAMAAAPAIVRFVGGDVGQARALTEAMYDITLAEHDVYRIPALGFRGTPVGIDPTLVVRSGLLPAVNTGMAGRVAGTGQVGAGLVEPPMACFVDAVRALGAEAPAPGAADRVGDRPGASR